MNFQSNFEDDGHVVFVISNKSSSRKLKRLVGFSNGVVKRVSYDSLSVEHAFKLPLASGEQLTCGFYSENNVNFAIGTSYGTIFIGSLKVHGRSRVEATYCRIDSLAKTQQNYADARRGSQERLNIDLDADKDESLGSIEENNSQDHSELFTGVTSIHFQSIDPIGTMVVAFDDGSVKLWQSSVKNEPLMKILDLQQQGKRKGGANQPVIYDISEVGY